MAPKTSGAAFAWWTLVADRKTIIEMAGEFLREAAVLTAVFIPLDLTMMRESLTVGWWSAILGISGGLLAAGMTLERKRTR